MKPNHAVNIFIALVLVVTLVGCNPNLNSTAAIRKLAFKSSSLPEISKLTEDTMVQPEPIAILFLIDKSGSVIGEGDGVDKCDAGIPKTNLPHIGAHYVATVLSHLPAPYSAYIHFGVSQFGDGYSSVIGFTPVKDLGNSTGMPILAEEYLYTDLTTNYAYALDRGYKDLKAYSNKKGINKQIIIILTDGLGVNRDSTEKVLANIPPGIQIYTNLVCPDTQGDTSFWAKHRIQTSKLPNEWLTNFWQIPDLKQALPLKGGWIDGQSNQKMYVNGDVNEVNFKYFPWKNSDDINFTVNGNNDFSLNTIPELGCVDHEFLLETRSTDAGVWWVETETPRVGGIKVSSPPLINDNPTKIDVHLSSEDLNSGEMAKWRDCYIDFTFEINTLSELQWDEPRLLPADSFCPDGGTGLCPENGGDELYGTWAWDPPKLQRPIDINVKVKLTLTYSSNNSTEIESKPYLMRVFFKPEFDSMSIPKLPDGESYFLDLKFNFDTDESKPTIYLLRSKNIPVREGCPVPVEMPDTELRGYFVHQNTTRNDLDAKAISSWVEGVGSYQLTIKRTVMDECDFDQIIFIWKANPPLDPDNWTWTSDLRILTPEEK